MAGKVFGTFIKIATLNLCLGLKFKKDLVKDILMYEKIDILLMQETEINSNFDMELLDIPGYVLEVEKNDSKMRVAAYIKDSIKFNRRSDLEAVNSHIQFFDILVGNDNVKRLVNLYRSFNPVGVTAKDLFITQCDLIKTACNLVDMVVAGDFNLDYK